MCYLLILSPLCHLDPMDHIKSVKVITGKSMDYKRPPAQQFQQALNITAMAGMLADPNATISLLLLTRPGKSHKAISF